MTIDISNNDPRISYAVAQGVTQTSFAVPFEFFDDSDVNVYVDGTLKTITTDYTISGGGGSTGTVTISVTGATGGSVVVLTRDITIERTTDFTAGADINRAALNTQLDTLTAIAADVKDRAGLALSYNDRTVGVTTELPDVSQLKGRYLAFNISTGAPEAGATTQDVNALAPRTADIGLLADIEDGTIATNAITTVSSISSNVTTVANISSSVTTVAGISADVTAVSAIDSDVPIVSGISGNVTTVAGISANVTTVAGISADVTAVAGDATDIGTVATNIADIVAVAADATDIGTVATNIADINTAATNIAAIIAAPSEASAAAASAVSAANSAAAAAASFDSFDDRYLGVKASDPTLDNDGNALVSGALYFSSSENIMKVYDGASWIAATSAGNVSLLQYEYTATLGQTTFSGADDNSATLSYTVNNLIVTLNGVVLDNGGDYTATNGTSVVLTSGAAAGDLLQVIAFKSFTVADMVPASTGGTFAGNVAVNGNLTVDTDTLFVDAANNRVIIGDNTVSPAADAGDLVVGGSTGNNGITIGSATTGTGSLRFADTGGTGRGIVLYDHSSDFLSFHSAGNERARIDATGNLLVGKTTNTATGAGLWIYNTGDYGRINYGTNITGTSFPAIFYNSSGSQVGSITYTTTATAYNTSSDYRLKENVVPLAGAADRLMQIPVCRFNFIADPDRTVDGFLAHEVQAVVPECVTGQKDEVDDEGNPKYQGIDQSKLVPLLTAALQEALARIETLEADVAALKGEPA